MFRNQPSVEEITGEDELLCPFCKDKISSGSVGRCKACKTLIHQECFQASNGCPVYGCGCMSIVLQGNSTSVDLEQPVQSIHRISARRTRQFATWAAILGMFIPMYSLSFSASDVSNKSPVLYTVLLLSAFLNAYSYKVTTYRSEKKLAVIGAFFTALSALIILFSYL